MNDVVLSGDELEKVIRESMPAIFKEKFSSSYSSPIADIISEEIKKNDGVIRIFVQDILSGILNDEKFKDIVTKELISSILMKGLSR